MATGRNLPPHLKGSIDVGYLHEREDTCNVLIEEWHLSLEQLKSLAFAGDSPVTRWVATHLEPSGKDWPEAEIVQALLDKVDELEAQGGTK